MNYIKKKIEKRELFNLNNFFIIFKKNYLVIFFCNFYFIKFFYCFNNMSLFILYFKNYLYESGLKKGKNDKN